MEVSVLSITATLLIGAGCFALGYIFADSGNRRCKFANCGRFLFWMKKRSEIEGPEEADGEGDGQRKRRPKVKVDQSKGALVEIENLAEVIEDFKMVLVVRNDLKMGKGKIAAQCSHATLGLYKKLHYRAPKALARWEMCGQVKVVVKIESEEELLVLQARAKSLKLPNHVTVDAGRTQIAPNSRTVMAILGPSEMVDDVTGGLKLL